jgi:hypothetical protein
MNKLNPFLPRKESKEMEQKLLKIFNFKQKIHTKNKALLAKSAFKNLFIGYHQIGRPNAISIPTIVQSLDLILN